MAVKSKEEGQKLILEINYGDLTKLKEAMQKWGFKDYQSLLRFGVSLLLLAEDNFFIIRMNGVLEKVAPIDQYHFMKYDQPL